MKKLKLGILLFIAVLAVTGCSCSRKANEYTVTFDTQGGSSIESVKVKENETVSKPTDPTREGYTFSGWYLNLEDEETYDFSTKVTRNITLYAKWIGSATYTITLNINGEEITLETDANGLIAKPEDPVRSGYNFIGWYLDGEEYDFTTPFTSDSTLVAMFTKISTTTTITTTTGNTNETPSETPNETIEKLTVTFDSNGGSSVASKRVIKGGIVSAPTNPTREGYTFVEWQLDGKTYDFSSKVTKNITLKAVWSKNDIAVTSVSLNVNSLTLSVSDTYTLVATVNPSNATNKSVSWNSSDTSIVKVDSNGKITALKSGTATITVTTKDGSFTASVKITVVDTYTAKLIEYNSLNPEIGTIQVFKNNDTTPIVFSMLLDASDNYVGIYNKEDLGMRNGNELVLKSVAKVKLTDGTIVEITK